MKWVRLSENNSHFGSGEIEFAQLVLCLKMLNNDVSEFATSTDYEFGYNVITDFSLDEIEIARNHIEHISPLFTLIYHKGEVSELDEFTEKCSLAFGKDNFKVLKRITNNSEPSLWSHNDKVVDIGAFFLKPTPHYGTKKNALSDNCLSIQDYNLIMTSIHGLPTLPLFIDAIDTSHICFCENACSMETDFNSSFDGKQVYFQQIFDYGSSHWFDALLNCSSFCEPKPMLTCSALEALYLNKTLYFSDYFDIADPNFTWSPHETLWQLSRKSFDCLEKFDLRYKLIKILKLL